MGEEGWVNVDDILIVSAYWQEKKSIKRVIKKKSAHRVRWNPAPYQVSPVNQSLHLYQKHGRYVWELSAANSAASSAVNLAANLRFHKG